MRESASPMEAAPLPDITLPAAYMDVQVRCLLPCDKSRARLGLALNTQAGVVRYALDLEGARFLRDSLSDYLEKCGVQSPRSSESPSAEGSPHDGQSLLPPARSSTACCGVKYLPRSSSFHIACQPPERSTRTQNMPARLGWLYATMLMAAALCAVVKSGRDSRKGGQRASHA